jgi:hypothetical protein
MRIARTSVVVVTLIAASESADVWAVHMDGAGPVKIGMS